ncbi:hypothetical protein SRHO_G00020770 [Serrasalmus rhombeus]
MKGSCCKFLCSPQHCLICQPPQACLNLIWLELLKLLSWPRSNWDSQGAEEQVRGLILQLGDVLQRPDYS